MVSRNSIQETRADMSYLVSDDANLIIAALALALAIGLLWWWNWRAKKWLEGTGRVEVLPSRPDWLVGDGQQKPGTTLKYSEQEFQEMVANALDEVPEEFDKEWNNVAVVVVQEPRRPGLQFPKVHKNAYRARSASTPGGAAEGISAMEAVCDADNEIRWPDSQWPYSALPRDLSLRLR